MNITDKLLTKTYVFVAEFIVIIDGTAENSGAVLFADYVPIC